MNKINVAILQRAIPHYRLPLLKQLNRFENINLTIITGEYDINTTTGLPTEDYGDLNVRFIKIRRFKEDILFQQFVSLRKFDVLIMDISINILTNPFYILLAKLSGVKVIGWGKGIPQELNGVESPVKAAYKKFIASLCDGLLLYGEISRDYFNKLGLSKKPMFVAQNTIDTETIASGNIVNQRFAEQKRKELGLDGKFIFGYFGKLTGRKGVDQIIKAFKDVHSRQPNAVLVIAGSGPSEQDLKKLSEELDLGGSVYFLGRIPPGQEGVILHLFDAFLSFSQGGLGILEALASRCLIISTPEVYPETELLENNVNSLISNDFTVSSFALTMEKAISLGQLKQELVESAYKTVMSKATIQNMANAFNFAIKKITNQ